MTAGVHGAASGDTGAAAPSAPGTDREHVLRRIVVFTGDPSHSVTRGIAAIDERVPGLQWLVVHHAPPRHLRQLLRNQRLNLRRNGWRWVPYQIGDAGRALLRRRGAAPPALPPRPTAAGLALPSVRDFGLGALRARAQVRLERVDDIHGPQSLALVRAFAPDLGLSMAAPILRRPLFSIPRLGTLNLHKGRLPDFRGMPPAFWELWHGEREVGCSVHWVDDKLDTGAVVERGTLARSVHSTLRGLQLQLDELGHVLLAQAVAGVADGSARALPQTEGAGRTFRKPTLAQQGELRRKLDDEARARGATGTTPAARAKDLVFAGSRGIETLGLSRWRAPRVTVVLYHRVSDEVRDNLTVGIEQFDRQMAFLRRHCEPVAIEQVLAMQPVPASDRPLVAVTFDDGYLDNFTEAVPTLLRHRVPAAFFVSTGLIGSDGRFPHDVRRGNPAIPLMRWDDLRRMRDLGFTIGSHAVSHIDCAAEPAETVRDELAASMARLREELGLPAVIFAYPYGGRQHMTAERLAMVREAGYAGCLSAYGGSNVGTVDPFNVVRKGIHHGFSDRAFAWECLGLR